MNISSKKFCYTQLVNLKKKGKRVQLLCEFIVEKYPNILPFDFFWKDIDGRCLELNHELFLLLDRNYIEDSYSFLRFNYIHEFIRLATCSPNWTIFFNLGLRFKRTGNLNGFIFSTFRKIIIENRLKFCSEINFLCLQKKLRKKLFVQILIKEITRRLNGFGITSAIYTTALPFFKPFSNPNYFYSLLNAHKDGLPRKFFFENKNNIVSKIMINIGLGKFCTENAKNLKNLRKNFLKKKIYKHFGLGDFNYWMRSIKGLKITFIKKSIYFLNQTSIISFYFLPCKTIRRKKSFYFYDAYSYYGTMSGKDKLFVDQLLCVCRQLGFDLFYILEGTIPEQILYCLNFYKSNSKLNFYMLGDEIKYLYPLDNGLIFF